MATRPEPTSIGNCDSWRFIVGKNAVGRKTGLSPEGDKQWCERNSDGPIAFKNTLHAQKICNHKALAKRDISR